MALPSPLRNLIEPILGGLQQLDQWLKKKVVRGSRELEKQRTVKLADPYDPKSGTLEERVRAYLHMNWARIVIIQRGWEGVQS